MKNKRRTTEILIVAALLTAACVALLVIRNSKTKAGHYAEVSVNGAVVQNIRLDEEGLHYIDALLPVTLEVTDGKIHFINSQCPDHLCEHFGLLSEPFEYAICLPARASVQIVEDTP